MTLVFLRDLRRWDQATARASVLNVVLCLVHRLGMRGGLIHVRRRPSTVDVPRAGRQGHYRTNQYCKNRFKRSRAVLLGQNLIA
jgi:hypothetical protein